MYCFDTDVLSAAVRRDPPLHLIRRLAQVPPAHQFTTAVTQGELLYGAARRGGTRLAAVMRDVIDRAQVILPFDSDAAEVYGPLRARLESEGAAVAEPDLRIACIALCHDLTLVTGRPETWTQAFYARDLAGTVVLVGVPTPDMTLELPLIDVFGRGGSLKSSWYGDCLPERDFPMLVDLHLEDRLPLERFVSETIGLDVWLVGDDRDVIVIDAAHDADAIATAVGDRQVRAIVCTHAHDDHVNRAPELARRLGAPLRLHPAEHVLWELAHPGTPPPDGELADGDVIHVAGTELRALHTPGHSPGSVCLHAPELGVVFTGDTLFQGGPGATGRSYSDYDTLVGSIRTRLLTLPDETEVRTGHGDSTTVGSESPHLADWIARGG